MGGGRGGRGERSRVGGGRGGRGERSRVGGGRGGGRENKERRLEEVRERWGRGKRTVSSITLPDIVPNRILSHDRQPIRFNC